MITALLVGYIVGAWAASIFFLCRRAGEIYDEDFLQIIFWPAFAVGLFLTLPVVLWEVLRGK